MEETAMGFVTQKLIVDKSKAAEALLQESNVPDLLVLTCTEGPCKGTTFKTRGNLLTIGRTNRSTICIKDASVSEKHAKMEWDGHSWLLQDIGSSNGTRVNGNLLEPEGQPTALNDQDIIQFGESKLAAEVVPVPAETVAVEPYLWAECARYEARVRAKCAQLSSKLADDWRAAKQDLLQEVMTSM